jgi:hypothetical protein
MSSLQSNHGGRLSIKKPLRPSAWYSLFDQSIVENPANNLPASIAEHHSSTSRIPAYRLLLLPFKMKVKAIYNIEKSRGDI